MEKNKLAYKILNQKHFSLCAHQNLNSSSDNSFIYALYILSFDDEIGQIIEAEYPKALLDKVTAKNLTGLGFPETNSLENGGELHYVFKLRKSIYLIT